MRNYWKYLKAKLKKENSELVSATTQFKFIAPDGKKRIAYMLESGDLIQLARHYPNNRIMKLLDWFFYSDNSQDGQSKKKVYSLYGSKLINEIEVGTTKGLQQIHDYLFGGICDFAGQIREKSMFKGTYHFVFAQYLKTTIRHIDTHPQKTMEEILFKYAEMNKAHLFP